MTDLPSLVHPNDHFSLRAAPPKLNNCFVLMPFDRRLEIVYQTIVGALKELGVICTRADDLRTSHAILDRIITGIRSAEFVIAVLTGRNPNVFYELGIAHVHTKKVLLLAQNIKKDVPFDLRQFFCFTYSRDSQEDLKELAEMVKAAALQIRIGSVPEKLDGVPARTELIVQSMESLLSSAKGLRGLVIRTQAGFSSLSNPTYQDAKDKNTRDLG